MFNKMFRSDEDLDKIKKRSSDLGIEESEFDDIYRECCRVIKDERRTKLSSYLKSFLFQSILFCLLFHNFVSKDPLYILMGGIQHYAYPAMRLWRLITLPVLNIFPYITEYYYKTCLIENPYFFVKNMSCTPCSQITSIEILQNDNFKPETSPPFLYETEMVNCDFLNLKKVYIENREVFDEHVPSLLENGVSRISVGNFFHSEDIMNGKEKYYIWYISKILPIQLIRKIIPRPKIVPRKGQSIERYIAFNQPNARYKIPDMECNYSFIIQVQGERIIELEPTKECQKECKKQSVELPQNHLLWYNWWYWRAESLPSASNEFSISYMGSYC